MSTRVVVVGGSLAGIRAARALRRSGHAGPVTIVGAERHFPPYDRPPLSKEVLRGAWTSERGRLDVRGLDDVELLLGRRADGVDLKDSVVWADGDRLAFDGLVIATGATPRPLPAPPDVAERIHLLRTIEDSLALRSRLAAGSRVTVVGAGFLGCEVAATAAERGCHVDLVDRLPTPMHASLGATVGEFVARLHARHGVSLALGASITSMAVVGDAVLTTLDSGAELAADTVVAAIGASPVTSWLAGSGLKLDDGVGCDQNCFAIGSPNVVAAGDVARWEHPLLREFIRVEHWTNAAMQGDAAGHNLAARLSQGEPKPYDALPYFWTHQYGVRLQFVGSSQGRFQVAEGSPDEERFVGTFLDGAGRLVGALCVNRPDRIAVMTNAIRKELA